MLAPSRTPAVAPALLSGPSSFSRRVPSRSHSGTVPVRAGASTLFAIALLAAGCSGGGDDGERASNQINGGHIVVAGARPAFPVTTVPSTGGFLEETRWDDSIATLQCRGWAPYDVRNANVRFVLRDPLDRLRLVGEPLFTPQERADVAAAHPDHPEWRHGGFTASIRLSNLPEHAAWPDCLELYCLAQDGTVRRLARVNAPAQHTWDRKPERFECVLTYSKPVLAAPEKPQGSLDLAEPAAGDGTVRLSGWAPFDGRSPGTTLIVQLSPELAPTASLVSAAWVPRPDVRAAVDPNREILDRCGYEVFVRVPGGVDALREKNRLRLWCIDDAGASVEINTRRLTRGR